MPDTTPTEGDTTTPATTWVRTGHGRKIHTRWCHHAVKAKDAVPWKWAEGYGSSLELFLALDGRGHWSKDWNRFCYFCCGAPYYDQKIRLQAEL